MLVRRRDDGHGDIVIDHRDSPGISAELSWSSGVPVHAHNDFAKGKRAELKFKTCNHAHCQKTIILRPDRVRSRNICPKCDAYICDDCAVIFKLTEVCYPTSKWIEDFHRNAALAAINAKL